MATKGRPPKSDASTPIPLSTAPAKVVGVRLPTHISDQLERRAKAENNSVSCIVRRLLTRALAGSTDEAA